MALDDKQIRQALLGKLSKDKELEIYQEFVLPSSKARADIVTVGEIFTGYEIKSDKDSLQRLSTQIPEYDIYLEKNYIVVGEKYSSKIKEYIPKYWGIIVVSESKKRGAANNQLKIKTIRKAKKNPLWDFNEFLFFLPANDIKMIVKETSRFQKRYKRTEIQSMIKQNLVRMVVDECSLEEKRVIRKLICLLFRKYKIKDCYKNNSLLQK